MGPPFKNRAPTTCLTSWVARAVRKDWNSLFWFKMQIRRLTNSKCNLKRAWGEVGVR